MARFRTIYRTLLLAALALTVLYFAAFKAGWLPGIPEIFAAMVAATTLLMLGAFVASVVDVVRDRGHRFRHVSKALALAGWIGMIGGGSTNWLHRLQGFVLLTEGEEMPLFHGQHVRELDAGLLADTDELNLMVSLARLKLRPAGAGMFYPEATLILTDVRGEKSPVQLSGNEVISRDTLRFHRGAFGFSPRIVVLEGDKTLIDQTVPFITEKKEDNALVFRGEVEAGNLKVSGYVDLESLDDRMKGHAVLDVEVQTGTTTLGRGRLKMGHFADLDGGYRVGFAGLKKWLELDIARRTYKVPVLAGAGATLAGLLLWLVAVLLERRQK